MPLKVLLVTNMWPDGTRPMYGLFVKREADSLQELGVDVDPLPILGYATRADYVRASADVLRLNRHRRYDVVHAHYGHSALVARLQIRAPLVITYWGSDLQGKRNLDGSITPKTRVEAAVFRQLARVAGATITQNAQMEEALPPPARERNHVIPAGIDLQRFQPLPRDEARRRLGWDPDERVALFAGNPELSNKNYPLAEEVCRRLRSDGHPVRLAVAWGLGPDEVPVWMNAADALLVTSLSEGSPNVVKEAMAVELPVVTTRVGDVEELMAGVPGCFVRSTDADQLAQGLGLALEHGRTPEARQAMLPLGRKRTATRIAEVYESVLR